MRIAKAETCDLRRSPRWTAWLGGKAPVRIPQWILPEVGGPLRPAPSNL